MTWSAHVERPGAPIRRYWGSARIGSVSPARRHGRSAAAPLAVAALLVASGLALRHAALGASGLEVAAVHVTGAVRADAAAIAVATGAVGENVLRLDLSDVRQRVLAQPWVAEAAVRRRLPRGLSVTVVEEQAACLERVVGRFDVLDERGAVVIAGVEPQDFALPVIVLAASDADAPGTRARVAATLAEVRAREPDLFAEIEHVRAEPGLVALEPRSGPRLLLAGPESVGELSEWLSRAAELRRRVGDIEQVDARWRGRLWLKTTANATAGKG